MQGRYKSLRGAVCAAALIGMLAGCGGGGDSTTTTPNNNPPAQNQNQNQIQGIATPSSVAVVTATNAD